MEIPNFLNIRPYRPQLRADLLDCIQSPHKAGVSPGWMVNTDASICKSPLASKKVWI